jgi:hypothetical protein
MAEKMKKHATAAKDRRTGQKPLSLGAGAICEGLDATSWLWAGVDGILDSICGKFASLKRRQQQRALEGRWRKGGKSQEVDGTGDGNSAIRG